MTLAASTPDEPSYETSPAVLREAILKKVPPKIIAKGELLLQAVPELADFYTELLSQTFLAIGRSFTPEELDFLRASLKRTCEAAFAQSPYSRISVTYATDPLPKTTLTWSIDLCPSSIEAEYQEWVDTRTPPLFGEHPDAMATELALHFNEPAAASILDVGAGTGRNTLPLAKRGHPVDAVELAPSLAAILCDEAEARALRVGLLKGDFLDDTLSVPKDHYKLVLASEVLPHFRSFDDVRQFFKRASEVLTEDGMLAFSVFLAHGNYEPDEFTKQMSVASWCSLFTRTQLAAAAADFPLELMADESCLEFERKFLPDGHFPPTGWYENWARGVDLFELKPDRSPMEVRWLVYRKHGSRCGVMGSEAMSS